jgi:hypothetical protein
MKVFPLKMRLMSRADERNTSEVRENEESTFLKEVREDPSCARPSVDVMRKPLIMIVLHIGPTYRN